MLKRYIFEYVNADTMRLLVVLDFKDVFYLPSALQNPSAHGICWVEAFQRLVVEMLSFHKHEDTLIKLIYHFKEAVIFIL